MDASRYLEGGFHPQLATSAVRVDVFPLSQVSQGSNVVFICQATASKPTVCRIVIIVNFQRRLARVQYGADLETGAH